MLLTYTKPNFHSPTEIASKPSQFIFICNVPKPLDQNPQKALETLEYSSSNKEVALQ
jgi:hypothetical protein